MLEGGGNPTFARGKRGALKEEGSKERSSSKMDAKKKKVAEKPLRKKGREKREKGGNHDRVCQRKRTGGKMILAASGEGRR